MKGIPSYVLEIKKVLRADYIGKEFLDYFPNINSNKSVKLLCYRVIKDGNNCLEIVSDNHQKVFDVFPDFRIAGESLGDYSQAFAILSRNKSNRKTF